MSNHPGPSLDPARDKWLIMFAHDLRKPLCGIISSLHLLGDMLAEGDQAALDQVLNISVQSGQDMLRMLETMPLPDTAMTGELQRIPVRLSALVERIFVTQRLAAWNVGSQLVNRLSDDLPLLDVDENRTVRVLINLLDNAIRYAPGSQIRVEAAPDLVIQGETRFVQVGVIDTGQGILPEHRERIFEFFYRGPESAAVPETGSTSAGYGLGLAFCKLTVEAHGGRIWVESGPEGGAAFWFTLPVVSSEGS